MALWRDSLGNPIDVTDIDKEYALNILTMVLLRRGGAGCSSEELRIDPLIKALRETVLHGREPNEDDKARAAAYNKRNAHAGLPFRAPVEDERDAYPGAQTSRMSCSKPNFRRVVEDSDYVDRVPDTGDDGEDGETYENRDFSPYEKLFDDLFPGLSDD